MHEKVLDAWDVARYQKRGRTNLYTQTNLKYVWTISRYHSLEDKCIMHYVHQMDTHNETRLQLHLSAVTFQLMLLNDKCIMQNLQRNATHNQQSLQPSLIMHTIPLAIKHYRTKAWCMVSTKRPYLKPVAAVLLQYAWHFGGHHTLMD